MLFSLIVDGVLVSLRDSDWKTVWPQALKKVKILDFLTSAVIIEIIVPSATLKRSLGYLCVEVVPNPTLTPSTFSSLTKHTMVSQS